MTERTIRTLAKKLASEFYTESAGNVYGHTLEDRQRSKRYRETFPTLEHFLKGYQVQTNGKIKVDQPGWRYFVTLARARMVQVLATTKSETVKEGIYAALLEEHQKSTAPAAQELLQRRLDGGVAIGRR